MTGKTHPLVFYGHDNIPGKDEVASGGIVKIQDLLPIYPNTLEGANIIYLVSSALPHYSPVMLRQAKKKGCKVVVNQNGTAFHGWYGKGWQDANKLLRQVIEMADYVFYQSEFCKKAADYHLIERTSQFETLYNPVDTSYFVPSEGRGEFFCILLAGSHHQFYRVQSAVDAFSYLIRSLPTAKLTIAGKYRWGINELESVNQLTQYIQASGLGDHIKIEGAYTQKEALSLFQSHDMLLHTKYNDPCPRLIVEALSCGLPVVYSESGGVPELVGDAGVGIPAPCDWNMLHPPDPELLAEAVCKVKNSYDDYTKLARTRAVTRFDVRPWLEKHQYVFDNVLK